MCATLFWYRGIIFSDEFKCPRIVSVFYKYAAMWRRHFYIFIEENLDTDTAFLVECFYPLSSKSMMIFAHNLWNHLNWVFRFIWKG